ncbi:hypothetical protein CAEBREN_12881 [Caenorhabditis brenneri]|uniref:Uncharacterized protein n=1 Tax=Caenorhabditis brenneri TaxID=135651 RepID=G0MSL1_CAEBE|nr:hypothetical protein CAEBREN_12881 [Caenorhabditis brenneri]
MWISTSFSFFYWTLGAVEYEEDYGTSKFVCVSYLYVFIYLPNFCVNLVHCTISILLITYYRKTHEHCCGLRLNNFNIRTFYVVIMNLALCDVLFFFCISWIAMAKGDEEKNYQTKCFVLLNPLFQRAYMVFALYKMFTNHMLKRRGEGIQLREKQHHGGSVTTLAFTTIFMIIEMCFYLFCDIYEISLHYSLGPTNADFFFSLKNGKTIVRTTFALLSPFQLLALSSFNPDFQSTMQRYLNGTYVFNVTTQKTIGGDTKVTVNYEPLPEPSKLTWLAWLYYKWCRCYFFVCIFRRFLDLVEDSARNRRQRQRQKRLNRAIARERKANGKKLYTKVFIVKTNDL